MVVQSKPPLSRFFRMAVVAGVESAVRIHIERGDDLNARDDRGHTPLMLSVATNKPHICKLLLDAGADPSLVDADGNDALSLAICAGAHDTVAFIRASLPATTSFAVSVDQSETPDAFVIDDSIEAGEVGPIKGVPASEPAANEDISPAPEEILIDAPCTEPSISVDPLLTAESLSDYDDEGVIFDLGEWEAVDELATPEGDPTVLIVATEIQKAISDHVPIDSSADWDDVQAFLPEHASPLPKADDAEARERLRSLLLRAAREGSVPNLAIEDLSRNDDQSPNEEAESLLRMVVNDLGAEADDRIEYSTPYESFKVHIEPRETPDEEDIVDSAIALIDNLDSRRNDPLRMYQRAFQNEALLTADEEIALGKAMERTIEAALDALAESPSGINAVIEASLMVKSGEKSLRWMSSGPREDTQELSASEDEVITAHTDSTQGEVDKDPQDTSDESATTDEWSDFLAKVEHLHFVIHAESKGAYSLNEARDALGALGLSRTFLLDLAEANRINDPAFAKVYAQAMRAYRSSRDRMVVANLKLVHSIAKKYMYSGMPLDDLLQEGNIGLIKGVERFDWRRGFKFSTYATWWIRQQISRSIADKSKTIRLPVHVYEKIQRIAHAARIFEDDHGRQPTTQEIADLVDLSGRKVAAYQRIAGEPLPIHLLDLDVEIASDSRDEFAARDPMDVVSDQQLAKLVHRFLGTLKLKDENVLRMRFGIGIPDVMTLEEIGARFDLTRERIRQIETQALRRLKHPARLNQLLRDLNGPNPPQREQDDVADDAQNDVGDSEMANAPKEEGIAAKRPRKNARKPDIDIQRSLIGISGNKAAPSSNDCGLPLRAQRIVNEASEVGADVLVEQSGSEQRVWINFNSTASQPSRPLIRKLLAAGFKFWPGKGYWR